MDINLEQIIFNENKTLFRDKPYYGIETDDGWYPIIYTLCESISNEMRNMPSEAYPSVQTIKEKFGGLRFYYSWADSSYKNFDNYALRIEGMVDSFERLSRTVCEMCGCTFGVKCRSIRGWYKSECYSCHLKRSGSVEAR